MPETLWISPSGMMHKSTGFTYVTKCKRNFKGRLSLRPKKWRRALISQEFDPTIPRCSQCVPRGNKWLI